MESSQIIDLLTLIIQQYEPSLMPYLKEIEARTGTCSLRPGDRFPPPGQSLRQAAYLAQGVFRVYSVDETKEEKIVRLPSEGDFTMRLAAYHDIRPNVEYYWEALTDASLLTWQHEDMEYLARTVPNWYSMTVAITQRILLQLAVERAEMFNDDATLRYQKFVERYPSVAARVPLRYVASYLGIAPQSLSRIRQHLGKQCDIALGQQQLDNK